MLWSRLKRSNDQREDVILAKDSFTQDYLPLLDDSYDVVDRIVLNAYFSLGQKPDDFRTWAASGAGRARSAPL